MTTYSVTEWRVFAGRRFKARTNGAGACVYLPEGGLDAVADSKTGRVLSVPAAGLVAYAKAVR
jgi:hypothetical protein